VRNSGLDQYRSAFGNRPAIAAARVLPLSSSGSSAGKAAARVAAVDG